MTHRLDSPAGGGLSSPPPAEASSEAAPSTATDPASDSSTDSSTETHVDTDTDRSDRARRSAALRLTRKQRLSILDVKLSPYLYVSPFFFLFAVVGLFPLVYTAYVSVFDWSLLGGKGEFVGLQNFRDVLGNPYFLKSLVNTISIFLLSSLPQVVIAAGLAGLLDTRLRSRTLWRMSVLLPFVVSPVVVAIVFGNLFGDSYGLINQTLDHLGLPTVHWHTNRFASHLAIASMVNWRWTGYNALIFLAAMQAVPRDLYESASLDGAGPIRQFLRITLPMIRPTMIFVVITSTIGGLQIFAEPRLFDDTVAQNGGSDRQFGTLTMLIYDFGWHLRDLGRASATAWLLFLLIVAIALVNFAISRRLRSLGGGK